MWPDLQQWLDGETRETVKTSSHEEVPAGIQRLARRQSDFLKNVDNS